MSGCNEYMAQINRLEGELDSLRAQLKSESHGHKCQSALAARWEQSAKNLASQQGELKKTIALTEEAYCLLAEATLTNHHGHFDPTGGSGTGCPECLRVRDLRDKAESIYREAMA